MHKHTIVTIANYPFETNFNSFVMAHMWFESVTRNCDLDITVLSSRPIDTLFPEYSSRVKFVYQPEFYDERDIRFGEKFKHAGLAPHNVRYKLFHLSRFRRPFIYLDMDMYVLDRLEQLISLSENKPYVGIDQPNLLRNPEWPDAYLNSGFQLVNNPTMLDWDALLKILRSPTYKAATGGTDQSLLYTYFKSIDYDYHHEKIGIEWNAPAALVTFERKGDQFIATLNGSAVRIVHYFGKYRPYRINCPIFKEYQRQCLWKFPLKRQLRLRLVRQLRAVKMYLRR